MTTVDFITALFYEVDEQMGAIPKHPEAHLWPSEVVTLGLLHALKGVGNRPFYRWLTRDYRALFLHLPERIRLFRLFKTHHDWTQVFLAAPTVLGGIDTYGIELIHPIREGRSPQQIGRRGFSNHRWIVGGKLCLLLNQWGLIVGWACATTNVADNTFQWLVRQCEEQMIVLSDTAFHAMEGDPANLKLCQRGAWEDRSSTRETNTIGYYRFPLSDRDVEEMLLARGIEVTHEAIRQWCLKFGQDYANQLKHRRAQLEDKWHLDEVFLTINGQRHYLWRAVDQDDVLDILVQSRRNKHAAKKFFRKLLKGLRYVPRVIITDKLKS